MGTSGNMGHVELTKSTNIEAISYCVRTTSCRESKLYYYLLLVM